MGSTKYRTGHAKRKTNFRSRLQRLVEFEEHTARRDIAGEGLKLAASGGKYHGKRKRKPHGAADLLGIGGGIGLDGIRA